MSLVIEALRRLEKADARSGSIGVAVASYEPMPRPRSSVAPLLLGLLTGGAVVFLFGTQSRNTESVAPLSGETPSAPARPLNGAAGLPPPLIIETAPLSPRVGKASESEVPDGRGEAPSQVRAAVPSLVLQAVSERDSRPIAVINDQLVKEGDRLGSVRVLRIGGEWVEVVRENGQRETVRFAPPPGPSPETSPSPDPHP